MQWGQLYARCPDPKLFLRKPTEDCNAEVVRTRKHYDWKHYRDELHETEQEMKMVEDTMKCVNNPGRTNNALHPKNRIKYVTKEFKVLHI